MHRFRVRDTEMAAHDFTRPDGSRGTWCMALPPGAAPRPRPALMLLHGSGADSVFPREGDAIYTPLLFTSLEKVAADWNVCFVEKRGVRLGDLARGAGYDGCTPEYVAHATRDERIADAALVAADAAVRGLHAPGLAFVAVGSSEGADIAAGLAARCPEVTHAALLPFSAGHGLADCLRALRAQLTAGALTEEESDEQYAWLVNAFRDVRAHPDAIDRGLCGHAYRRWASYAFGAGLADLLRVDVPIFLGIASLDQPEAADQVVAEFVRAGKANLTYRNYLGFDHGFFEVTGEGPVCRHDEVLADVLAWVAATPGGRRRAR